ADAPEGVELGVQAIAIDRRGHPYAVSTISVGVSRCAHGVASNGGPRGQRRGRVWPNTWSRRGFNIGPASASICRRHDIQFGIGGRLNDPKTTALYRPPMAASRTGMSPSSPG